MHEADDRDDIAGVEGKKVLLGRRAVCNLGVGLERAAGWGRGGGRRGGGAGAKRRSVFGCNLQSCLCHHENRSFSYG